VYAILCVHTTVLGHSRACARVSDWLYLFASSYIERLVTGVVHLCTALHVTWPNDAYATQPCIPAGSLNRVPASAGVRARMSPLSGGR